MTDEQRKQFIKEQIEIFPADCEMGEFLRDMAKLQPCTDAISRQAAKANIVSVPIAPLFRDDDVVYRKVIFADVIDALPPVTVQEKTGRWIDDKCSVCGKGIEDLISSPEWYRNEEPYFCPFCGAKLVELQESEGKE